MLQGPLEVHAHHTHMLLSWRGQRCLHWQGQNGCIAICVTGAWPRQREGALVVPGRGAFYSPDSFPFPILPPPAFAQCWGDSNLTWLQLHRQKCHIIILIRQRALARWQAWKQLPASEGGGSSGRETAEGITTWTWCRAECTNNSSRKKNLRKSGLTSSTRRVRGAPHTDSRCTARLAWGWTPTASSSSQWGP